MKQPFLLTLLAVFTAILFIGCGGDTTLVEADGVGVAKSDISTEALGKNGRSDDEVVMPFMADFYSEEVSLVPDPACGAVPNFLVTQEGPGEATHLGRFTFYATFCVDATDLLDDGVLSEGESIPYSGGSGVLTAANGDELWLEIAGTILPVDDPVFEFIFEDPFQFVGGTGRFENAAGDGVTKSLVDSDISRTQHEWSGELRLPRGN